MKKSLVTFIVLSFVIAFFEVVFVVQNYRQQLSALENHLQEKIAQVHSSFDLALLSARQQMTEIASFMAQSFAIQQTFLDGRKAVEAEGGGAGGADAARMREKLLTLSQGRWQELEQGFDFLEVQYHLPGKATSFLRVHEPGKFGDSLVPFRLILPEAHEKKVPVSGLEIGRRGLYIRGVAPVFAFDEEFLQDVYVGSLEFATSMKRVIENVSLNQGVDIVALLDRDLLQEVVWPDQMQKMLETKVSFDHFLIAETSFPEAQTALEEEHFKTLLSSAGMSLHGHEEGDSHHWMAAFPLRDFWGELNPQRPPAGLILISSDETSNQQAIKSNLQKNIIVALLGFVFIEVLLWFILQLTARKLERLVEEGRCQLEEKNNLLQAELLEKDQLQKQREELISDLQTALEEVKDLSGLLPICSYCKKIRDDEGYWQRLEEYIEGHSTAQFSHGICHECIEEKFPEMHEKMQNQTSKEDKSVE